MEKNYNNHFRKTSNNDSQKEEKGMDIEFLDNKCKFYQEDDYYLNKIFSFNDEEDEKEQLFLFPIPFCDLEEDKNNNYYNNNYNLNKDINLEISNNNNIISFGDNNDGKNQINLLSSNNIIHNNQGDEIMEKM